MDVDELSTSVQYTRIVSYVQAASIAILTYDTLLMLDSEITAIWTTKLNIMKCVYLLTRYSAFVEAAVVILQLTISGERYNVCALAFKLNALLFVVGLGAGEAIMTNRTWVVWQKNRKMMYILPIFYVVTWGAGFASTALFLKSLKFDPNPRTPYIGCYATDASPIIFLCWVLIGLYDFVMLILMAIPSYQLYRSRTSSRFLKVVYRDGTVYYIYLFLLSLINIIIALTFPKDLILIISLMLRIIHALLACRVMLHINESSRRQAYMDTNIQNIQIPDIPTQPSWEFQDPA